jgi:threonine dehydrogenase-like Zn-dependent dehydrogenase
MTAPSHAAETARYVTGSTMRHVIVLAGTGAIGLIAVFGVDLLGPSQVWGWGCQRGIFASDLSEGVDAWLGL